MRKNINKFLLTAVVLLSCFIPSLVFGQATNMINYSQNNGTNAGIVVTLPNTYIPNGAFNVQFGAITNNPLAFGGGSYTTNGITNSVGALWEVSSDPAFGTFITIASINPFGTNGEFDRWTIVGTNATIYQRVVAFSTNSLPIGVWKTQ